MATSLLQTETEPISPGLVDVDQLGLTITPIKPAKQYNAIKF